MYQSAIYTSEWWYPTYINLSIASDLPLVTPSVSPYPISRSNMFTTVCIPIQFHIQSHPVHPHIVHGTRGVSQSFTQSNDGTLHISISLSSFRSPFGRTPCLALSNLSIHYVHSRLSLYSVPLPMIGHITQSRPVQSLDPSRCIRHGTIGGITRVQVHLKN